MKVLRPCGSRNLAMCRLGCMLLLALLFLKPGVAQRQPYDCTPKRGCTAPGTSPVNGYFIGCNDTSNGATCIGYCKLGFEGAPTNTCDRGSWKGWSTSCIPTACQGNPPATSLPGTNVPAAVFSSCGINGRTPLNGTCQGTCLTGIGRPTARCILNNQTGTAEWTTDVCQLGCIGKPPLLTFPGGFIGLFTTCGDFSSVNQTCAGTCTNGVGVAVAQCVLAAGGTAASWTPLAATCSALPGTVDCVDKPSGGPGDGTSWPDQCANALAGFNCSTTCSGNFSQVAGGPPTAVCLGGTWSTVVNSCVPTGAACATMPPPGEGFDWPEQCANVSAGFACTTNCSETFASTTGPPTVVCQSDGSWTENNNTCQYVGRNHRRLAGADNAAGSDDPERSLLLRTSGVDIEPLLTLPGGRPLLVAPLTIKEADWERTPAELAACLSAALVTVEDHRLLSVHPHELEAQVKQHMEAGQLTAAHARRRVAAITATDNPSAELLRLLGSGGLYLSPMHVSSRSLKLQTLKDDLSLHFDSLVRLPKCLVVPFSLQQVLQRASQPGVDVSVRVKRVVQAHHPERCEGVEGVRFSARVLTSLAEVAAAQRSEPETSMWVFVGGSTAGDSCAALAHTAVTDVV